MTATRRNLLYPVMIIVVGVVLLLLAVDVLPEYIADLLERSWAALLVLIGLSMFLHGRVRFGNIIAIVLVGAVAIGMIYYAYSLRTDDFVTERTETLEPIPLGDHIQAVRVQVETLNTKVTFVATEDFSRTLGAEFQGSDESDVSISAQENEQGVVEFKVIERQSGAMPTLPGAGRSQLIVYLPVGVPIDLDFASKQGPITFDFRALDIPRFNATNESGDIDLYMPLAGVTISDVTLGNGNLLVVVDPRITLSIRGSIGNVEANENNYDILRDNTVESQNATDVFDFQLRVNMPNGALAIMSAEEQAAQPAQEQN